MKIKHRLLTATLLLGFSSALYAVEQTATRTVEVDLTSSATMTVTTGAGNSTITMSSPQASPDGTRVLGNHSLDAIAFSSSSAASLCEINVSSPNVDADGKFKLVPSSGQDTYPISFSLDGSFVVTAGNPNTMTSASTLTDQGNAHYGFTDIRNGWYVRVPAYHTACGISIDTLSIGNYSQNSIPSSVTGTRTATINFLMRVI
jgi:hypothetical protein